MVQLLLTLVVLVLVARAALAVLRWATVVAASLVVAAVLGGSALMVGRVIGEVLA